MLDRMVTRADGVAPSPSAASYLRPKSASEYLIANYGHGAVRTLAKLRVLGGGPKFQRIGRMIVYRREALDEWALAKISAPQRSTSDIEAA